ncbi:MAG: AAA family ATPase [Stackebrandtia sp.]
MTGRLILITGAQASGKTTVGRALAQRLTRTVHVDGDVVGGFVVSGEIPYDVPPPPGAVEQLYLRYRGSLAAAGVYRQRGFDAIVTDNMFGQELVDVVGMALEADDRGVYVVVLDPDVETIKVRERDRPKTGYSQSITPEMLLDAVRRDTPRIGLWHDSRGETVDQTATALLAGLDAALVTRAPARVQASRD